MMKQTTLYPYYILFFLKNLGLTAYMFPDLFTSYVIMKLLYMQKLNMDVENFYLVKISRSPFLGTTIKAAITPVK